MPRPLIVCHQIHRHFHTGNHTVHALNGLTFQIPNGQFLAVQGPSGSGKSTLLYCLGGLDRLTSGTIVIDGSRLETMNDEELARYRQTSIGFVFQAFHLLPNMTAQENVGLQGLFARLPRHVREQRALKLLNMLGMREYASHKPSQLSGGQQQRVAIARALFGNPRVILADEPTGSLDFQNGQLVLKLLQNFSRRYRRTVIVVTHDQTVSQYADRVIVLQDGKISEDHCA